MRLTILLLSMVLLPCIATSARAQEDNGEKLPPAPAPPTFDVASAIQRSCDLLLDMAEGDERNEWAYEGVYRVRDGRERVIPLGYRIGGTAIVCSALVAAPGYADHADRRDAVARGVAFVLEALTHPSMQPSTSDTYDVRGWGHIYALQLFLDLTARDAVPEASAKDVAERTPWLVETLKTQAIPAGGWNYANRRAGAPFMTAPALQTLFAAAAHGFDVPPQLVDGALDSLERARAKSGSVAYGTPRASRADTDEDKLGFMDKLPGSMGRMLAVETTLMPAGRGDQARLRIAVDAFFTHWPELEKRRQKQGTHDRPYGVAPYYFVYAHTFAARAIEMLEDVQAREEARARLLNVIASVQDEGGGWNDRVFERSRAFGTAMMILALTSPTAAPAATWPPPAKAVKK